jgi:flagellar biosynthetic protein FliQ
MNSPDFAALLRSGLVKILILCAPVLGAALLAGLVAAILQAFTAIQDQVLSFVPKLFVVLVVLVLLAGWMLGSLGDYTRQIFALIPSMAR